MTYHIQSHSVNKTLTEWLSYLEQLHPVEIDLGLTRIKDVAHKLNLSFEHSLIITVAGTNGKGTTCAFIENALLAENIQCAVYSSPHIEHFNERLRINNKMIDDQSLVSAFEQIEYARDNISLTYYEYTTLAALLILMAHKPSVIILEVGLGGRLDATNIVDADIAVITTIALDHQAFLGNTREEIAIEKAGIMRANTPAVIGDSNPPDTLVAYVNNLNALAFYRQEHFKVSVHQEKQQWLWQSTKQSFLLNLPCHIPQDNIATAIKVLELLEYKLPINLTTKQINNIIEQTKVAGRLEKFSRHCDVIVDVAHNPQAAQYLAQQITQMKYNNIYAVVGMLADKDIKATLQPLDDLICSWYLGTLDETRASTAKAIAKYIDDDKEKINCFDNIVQAYKMAELNAESSDLILVFGSFYTVAKIRHLLVQ